jgi:CubicO group peptidase (beta-lactamase class C family)
MTAGVDPKRAERITELTHRYVDDGRLPGVHVLVTRRGQTVIDDVYGMADIAAGRKLAEDTIYRIYSMTKPIASVALMQLFEQGAFLLEDPLSRYLPELAGIEVAVAAEDGTYSTAAPEREVNFVDVLTHQSGMSLTPPGQPSNVLAPPPNWPPRDLAALVTDLGGLPLRFAPGSAFEYGISTDVVARLVEVLSGMPFDRYLEEHVFGPLGMVDTAFFVPPEKLERFAEVYSLVDGELTASASPLARNYLTPPSYFSGAGGLVSTTADYQRFCEMLVNRGERAGERVIGRKTLELMTMNHLFDNRDLDAHAISLREAVWMRGIGFGLGFSVVMDVARAGVTCSLGQYGWGGAASTYFWIDPLEQVTALMMTQFMPSSVYPIRRQLQASVYQSLD